MKMFRLALLTSFLVNFDMIFASMGDVGAKFCYIIL